MNNFMSTSDFTVGEMIIPGCNEDDFGMAFGSDDGGKVLVVSSKPNYNLVFTYKLSDELRKSIH